jgi:hypothetical protein
VSEKIGGAKIEPSDSGAILLFDEVTSAFDAPAAKFTPMRFSGDGAHSKRAEAGSDPRSGRSDNADEAAGRIC